MSIRHFIGLCFGGQLKTFTALPSVKQTGHSYRPPGYPPGLLGWPACLLPTTPHGVRKDGAEETPSRGLASTEWSKEEQQAGANCSAAVILTQPETHGYTATTYPLATGIPYSPRYTRRQVHLSTAYLIFVTTITTIKDILKHWYAVDMSSEKVLREI